MVIMNILKVYSWMILIVILFSISSSQKVQFHDLLGALDKIVINRVNKKCESDKDCSKIHQCIGSECLNPCPGSCGIEALCYVTNQTISCECPRCYVGDPHKKCETREGALRPLDLNPGLLMNMQFRSNTTMQSAYIIMCHVAVSGVTLSRFFNNRELSILPYKMYLPYNYSKPFLYRLTVLVQFITLFIGVHAAAGFDTLFFGVMLQIISRINILKHRLRITVTTLVEMHDKKSCNIKDYNEIEDKFFANWINNHNALIR
ncbi:hypothetical protein PV327_005188 [Microctonus hyperodae]|uniref:Uncharacterized protein n=1 Tax=Microctonus hyperodae TaxID=165561 RepID=A0AA39G1A7_MICHY|nr:hypothetical protein PV327_005188 [Microctonus hyperodae]